MLHLIRPCGCGASARAADRGHSGGRGSPSGDGRRDPFRGRRGVGGARRKDHPHDGDHVGPRVAHRAGDDRRAGPLFALDAPARVQLDHPGGASLVSAPARRGLVHGEPTRAFADAGSRGAASWRDGSARPRRADQPHPRFAARLTTVARYELEGANGDGRGDGISGGFVGYLAPEVVVRPTMDLALTLGMSAPVVQALGGNQRESVVFAAGLAWEI